MVFAAGWSVIVKVPTECHCQGANGVSLSRCQESHCFVFDASMSNMLMPMFRYGCTPCIISYISKLKSSLAQTDN